jgi:hypothetical protein
VGLRLSVTRIAWRAHELHRGRACFQQESFLRQAALFIGNAEDVAIVVDPGELCLGILCRELPG